MFSIVLDVVIGLLFIYLLYSLLATSVQEFIATILHSRANTLYKGIRSMLTNTPRNTWYKGLNGILTINSKNPLYKGIRSLISKTPENRPITVPTEDKEPLHKQFYDHPIIKNYGQNWLFKKPSYLSAENFVNVLLETIKGMKTENDNKFVTFSMVKDIVEDATKNLDADTRKILLFHLNEAAGDLDVFKTRLAKWYDDTMDRVSGWYKRNTQFWLLATGIVLAVAMNIDSVEIVNYLSDNKTAREQLAQMGAAAAGNQHLSGKDSLIADEAMDSIRANISRVTTVVGLGWGDYGSSDPAFKNLILKAAKEKQPALINAFDANLTKADSIYNDQLQKAETACDSAFKNKTKDLPRLLHLTDSLQRNKENIITQEQFSMLYSDDNFSTRLKWKYVLCFRLKDTRKWLGFLITAFAISLGAPFWFDLLNKFVSLRAAVKSVNSSGSTTKNNNADSNPELDG